MRRGHLADGGNTPESIRTEAKVQVLKEGDGFAIKKIDLVTVGRVPGVDDAAFQQTAQEAKETCPCRRRSPPSPRSTLERDAGELSVSRPAWRGRSARPAPSAPG